MKRMHRKKRIRKYKKSNPVNPVYRCLKLLFIYMDEEDAQEKKNQET